MIGISYLRNATEGRCPGSRHRWDGIEVNPLNHHSILKFTRVFGIFAIIHGENHKPCHHPAHLLPGLSCDPLLPDKYTEYKDLEGILRCRYENFIVISHDMDFGRIPAKTFPDMVEILSEKDNNEILAQVGKN